MNALIIAATLCTLGLVATVFVAMAETSRRDPDEWQDEADWGDWPGFDDFDGYHGLSDATRKVPK